MQKKVLVSGCFDLLHSGHVEFLRQAAEYGELHVALGADQTVFNLKGRVPVNSEAERRFMVENVACVAQAFISAGSGYLDFEPELHRVMPDIFVVNEDGNTPDKRELIAGLGIEYEVLRRIPRNGLRPRSTSDLRAVDRMPFRIDLAGGWLDQPYVSRHAPGSVITLSLEPTMDFNERSGMASSTRRAAVELWGNRLPIDDPERLARILFCCDNPPGNKNVSGAQDAIGIVYAGLARSDYAGEYWPIHIEHLVDEATLRWIENVLYLVPLGPRGPEYDVLSDTRIDRAGAVALAEATADCWQAVLHRDAAKLGRAMTGSFNAQVAMFPHMSNPMIEALIETYRETALGWKLSGAGGGGYLVLVSESEIENGLRCVARRRIE